MLSYKYYKEPGKKHIDTPKGLLKVNKILKDEYKKEWLKTLETLVNPVHTGNNRYSLWDIIGEKAEIILCQSMLSPFDQLYLGKLLCYFRDQTYIPLGIEYYCLKFIIRLLVFRQPSTIKWIANNIAKRINYLQTNNKAKKQCIIFARNIKKIEIIKRIYKSRVILREHWKNVYDCCISSYTAHQELLNQNVILKLLNINQLSSSGNINQELAEAEKIDAILDEELPVDSDAEIIIPSVEQDIIQINEIEDMVLDMSVPSEISVAEGQSALAENDFYNDKPDFIDQISPGQSDLDEPGDEHEEILMDPDEW